MRGIKLNTGRCGNGWFVRIDGNCMFDDPTIPSNPHTKPLKTFSIAEGLDSEEDAKTAAAKWLHDRVEALSDKPRSGMYGETPRVEVGDYTLCRQDLDGGNNSVWIEHEDGTGGSFPADKLEEVVEEFFNDNL
jgi:hypothetical protein